MAQRIPSDVTTGEAGKKGSVQASDDAGTPTAMGPFGAQFEAAPFDSIRGNAKGGSKHAGAPDNGGGNPALPGSVPLRGHTFMANPAQGNSPKRGAGSKTPSNPTDVT